MHNRQINLYVLIKESDFEKVDLRNNDSFALCKGVNKKIIKFLLNFQTQWKLIKTQMNKF